MVQLGGGDSLTGFGPERGADDPEAIAFRSPAVQARSTPFDVPDRSNLKKGLQL